MPLFFIHAINADFRSRDDGAEYDRPETALASGVQSAMAMAAEEIAQGNRSAAVEVVVERSNGSQVLRSVIAISVSPLSTTEGSIVPFPARK